MREGVKMPTLGVCEQCGYVSSQPVCKACVLLEGLNKGKPRLGLGKTSKIREHLKEKENHAGVKASDACTDNPDTAKIIDIKKLDF